MMDTELVAGDVVQLLSGGPPMTVDGFDVNDCTIVKCVWFSDDDRCMRAEFPIATLLFMRGDH